MVNFGPLPAEIDPVVWGTPANINGFRILAALLHGTLVVGVEERAPPIYGRVAITLGVELLVLQPTYITIPRTVRKSVFGFTLLCPRKQRSE